ncbi:MAG: LacI family DNA-binding transcriptional regulator, partial [Clostridia bacterium]|nr:LacI family DNA-binding transcriptional regulator [Clostridia bacterium]
MELKIYVEPDFSESYWCHQYLKGIRSEAKKNKLNVCVANELAFEDRPTELAMVLGVSCPWVRSVVSACENAGMRTVVVGYAPQEDETVYHKNSYVSLDYSEAVRLLLDKLEKDGRSRIALFAIADDSSNDLAKKKEFIARRGAASLADVYKRHERMDVTCESFAECAHKYDGVVCANDISAILLMEHLAAHGVSVPGDIEIATIGNSTLARTAAMFPMIHLDCEDIGKRAVGLYMQLYKDRGINSQSLFIRSRFANSAAEEQKRSASPDFSMPQAHINFTYDMAVSSLEELERILHNCDNTDIEILRALT